MSQFAITIPLTVHGPNLAEHFQRVADCYAQLETKDGALLDSAWSLTDCDTHGEVDVELTVEADDEAAALQLASSSVRAAIHHADGHTPGWDDLGADRGTVVYRLRDEADVALV